MVLNFPTSPINGQVSNDFYFDSSVGTEGAWRSSPVPIGGLPAGSIIQWAGATAPANWLICDGSAVSRTANASLFAVIGTTYGSGDGSTTFNLPDLRGRVAVGKNAATFGTLGATGGAEVVTLTEAQLPTINKSILAGWAPTGPTTDVSKLQFATTSATGSSAYNLPGIGGGQAHNNLQPYIVTNYIIKATSGWSAGDSELAQRVGVLEAAPAGLVRVIPTSVAVGSGSASVSSTGLVTFTSASSVQLNSVFTTNFSRYRFVITYTGGNGSSALNLRLTDSSASVVTSNLYQWYGALIDYANLSRLGGSGQNLVQISPVTSAGSVFCDMGFTSGLTFPYATMSNAYNNGSTLVNWWCNNGNAVAGMAVFPSAGTFSGTIQVYGYRN